MANGTETITPAAGARTRYAPRVFPATKMAGWKVRNPAGEDLGKIEELMIDVMSARIAYAVLSYGGIFGIGDKFFAVPWEALTMRPDDEVFIIDVPKERLENAPGFNKDEWPMTGDRELRPEEEEAWVRPPARMPFRARRVEEEERPVAVIQRTTVVEERPATTARTEPVKAGQAGLDIAPVVSTPTRRTEEKAPETTYRTAEERGRRGETYSREIERERTGQERGRSRDPCMYDPNRENPDYNCEWMEGMFAHFGYRPYWQDYEME
jgi:sporulation protein YlmC with PRC-barrel domain